MQSNDSDRTMSCEHQCLLFMYMYLLMSELEQLKCGVQSGIWGTQHQVHNECSFLSVLKTHLYMHQVLHMYVHSIILLSKICLYDSCWLTLMCPRHWSREEVAVSLSSSLPARLSRLFSTLALLLYTIYTANISTKINVILKPLCTWIPSKSSITGRD